MTLPGSPPGDTGKLPVDIYMELGLEEWVAFKLAGRLERQLQQEARRDHCTTFLTIHKSLYSF